MERLKSLIETAHQLRAPGGCPWDREQTHESLLQYLLEETYELIAAVESANREEVLEELGDVLYQVIFHADLAAEGSLGEPFDLEDVAQLMEAKMKHRHPHVYGDPNQQQQFAAETGEEVMQNWEAHKRREKPDRESILDGVPVAMPALALARKVIGKVRKANLAFDLLPQRTTSQPLPSSEAEFGDQLLGLVAAATEANPEIDLERALRQATRELMDRVRNEERSSTSGNASLQ